MTGLKAQAPRWFARETLRCFSFQKPLTFYGASLSPGGNAISQSYSNFGSSSSSVPGAGTSPLALHPASSFLVVRRRRGRDPCGRWGLAVLSPLLSLSLLKRKLKRVPPLIFSEFELYWWVRKTWECGKNNPNHHQEVLLTRWAAPHFTDEKAGAKREEKK